MARPFVPHFVAERGQIRGREHGMGCWEAFDGLAQHSVQSRRRE